MLRKRADEMAERARLLYVAMTRARERLLLFASPKDMTRGCGLPPRGITAYGRGSPCWTGSCAR